MNSETVNLKQPPALLSSLLSLLPFFIILLATFLRLYHLPVLPPGLNFDEAGNGVAAFDVLRGEPKLWWRIGGGKEPLWPYLMAASTTILGNIPLALRLPAALVGILSVAAVYPLGLVLFGGANRQGCPHARLISLLTMLGLALSAWHLHFSRLGFRAILLPLFSTLGFYFLWRSIVRSQEPGTGRRIFFALVLSAFFVALAVYAYLAARLLLLAPLLFFALHWLNVFARSHRAGSPPMAAFTRPLLLLISKFLFLLFLFLSPLLVYFLFHPADFMTRSTAVSIFNPAWRQGDLFGAAGRVLTLTLGTFVGFTGDPNPLVNLPGQPAVPVLLASFFLLGVLVSLYRLIRPRPLLSANPYLFLLCWWAVMLLPALLAPEGAPHHLRLIGAIVPTYLFIAVGMTAAAGLLVKLISSILRYPKYALCPHLLSATCYLLPAICYLLLALQTYSNYFLRWPAAVDFTLPFDLYAVRLANDIAQAPPDTVYVLPMDIRAGPEARHYTLDYLLASYRPSAYIYLPVDEHNAETLLTTRAVAGKNELRLVRWTADKHHEADAKEIVAFLLQTNAVLVTRESYPVYDLETYTLNRNASFTLPAITQPIGATFDNLLRLDAAFIPPTAAPGHSLPVALTFAPLAQMEADYKVSLRLISPNGERVAQKDRVLLHNFHQGTSLWPPETANEYYLLPIPSDAQPGQYTVGVVVYHPDTQAPLLAGGLVEVPLGAVWVK
ncbi:MAG: hypothetical protein JW953_22695 [Anaerolineae bacterium]|nr:hypothetical protein [Anaerolineae bacterium]